MKSKGKKPIKHDTKTASDDTTITVSQYRCFQVAFDFFNATLFNSTLPQVLVTLTRRGNTQGYFSPHRFIGRTNEAITHELALNPDSFTGRSDKEILSTLVHEMCHLQQQTHGHPPRRGYHDRDWGALMKKIGLHPSSTGQPGGKETGGHVSHFIIADGPFAKAYSDLTTKPSFKLDWQSKPPERKQRQSKTKFTCGRCGQNAWAKPDAQLVCGICSVPMTAATTAKEIAAAA